MKRLIRTALAVVTLLCTAACARHTIIPDDELEMLLAYGLGGLFSLYRWWLLSDRRLTIAEMTQLACQLVEGGVPSFMEGGARPGSL